MADSQPLAHPRRLIPTRREFLIACARAGAGVAVAGAVPEWARQALAATRGSGAGEIIVRNEWPEHWETSLEVLDRDWITPSERFYVRSHFPVPEIDAATWKLEIAGRVHTPVTFGMDQLKSFPEVSAVHTLECAGNGRALYKLPSTSGTQWQYGAVGNVQWTGFKLASLLEYVEVDPEAKHVWFEAADGLPDPRVPRFVRSLPIEKAREVLLAHTMNDTLLSPLHGAPMRAVVPGWYGMAWTKWVTKIRIEDQPSDNHFMVRGYRYNAPGEDPATAAPVEELRLKSIITRPLEGAKLPLGVVRIQGFAWAGSAGVRFVEISVDGGKTWQYGGFMGENAPLAWRFWATEVEVKTPRKLTILARATDGKGVVQPMAAASNAGGYANNSIQRVNCRVTA
jgi:DMSO/TMAO reductase YedYZ molybdopterin-dependent catalytic subunit